MNDTKDRILVVDDDESIVFLICRALERSGYEVDSATDGLKGLQILEDGSPISVLVTDLMMPKMSGIELLQRARDSDPFLEIIVITAVGSIQSAITAMRDGKAYDYLLKPFESIQQLVLVIDRAVAHRKLVIEKTAYQERAASEALRLNALVGNVGEAILATSADGIITIANPAAERLLERKDFLGEKADAVLPSKLLNIVENWQVIAGGRLSSLEIQWQPGIAQMVSLAPLPDQDSDQDGWAMVLRDITSLKRLERLKTQALYDAIGKIRLPMAEAMNAVVELNIRASQDSRLSDGLVRLTRVWEQIQSLGNELMTVVQEDAKGKLKPSKIDISALLDELADDSTLSIYKQRGGKIKVQVDVPLPEVVTDQKMIRSLLQGLIKRAASRSQSGGEVRIHAREYMNQVWIEISDDGPPASDANLLQIMDESMENLGKESKNSGLDFVRAKSILEHLDGQLWVGGQGAYGSSVIVCLPGVRDKKSD